MDRRELVYAPRAQRDLHELEKRDAFQVLDDLELLEAPPWPQGKVKKLRGHDFGEIKTGDFRTLFWPYGNKVVILRIVNRRDLERAIRRIDVRVLVQWLRTKDHFRKASGDRSCPSPSVRQGLRSGSTMMCSNEESGSPFYIHDLWKLTGN